MEGLQRSPTDHLTALSKASFGCDLASVPQADPLFTEQIPKNLRMMYVHAWQSYIWNVVASERVKLHGCTEPVVGDLVLLDGEATGEGELDAGAAEEPTAPVVESLEPNLDDGESVIASTDGS